jgi:hypothetical protein
MPRFHPRSVLIALLSLTLVAGAGVPAIAQDATPTTGEVTILGPDESFGGATLGEWNARWFQWALSFPADVNPNVNPEGAGCGYGQAGPGFFLPANFGPPGPQPAPGTYEIVLRAGPDVLVTYRITVEAPQVIEPEDAPRGSPEAATPAA